MKKQIFKTLALFSLLIVAGLCQSANAQTPAQVVVSVPFEFVAGGERLPAGRYEISRLSPGSEKALVVRSLDGRKRATVLTQAADAGRADGAARLAFRQYGGLYFLAEVRAAGAAGAREVPASRAEKELRRELKLRRADAGGAETAEGDVEGCQTVIVTGSLR